MTAAELIEILSKLPSHTRILALSENKGIECETNAVVEYPPPEWTCEGSPYILIFGLGDLVSLKEPFYLSDEERLYLRRRIQYD